MSAGQRARGASVAPPILVGEVPAPPPRTLLDNGVIVFWE